MKKALISAAKILSIYAIPVTLFSVTTENFTVIMAPVTEAMTFLCRSLLYGAIPTLIMGGSILYHNRKALI